MKTAMSRWKDYFNDGRIFYVTHAVVNPKWNTHAVAHDFAEVFWVCKGAGLHIVNKCQQEIQAGALCMIRPRRDAHMFHAKTPDFTIFNVSFPAAVLADIKLRYFDSYTFWGGNGPLPEIYRLTETEMQLLNNAALELFSQKDRLLFDRFILNLAYITRQSRIDPFRVCPEWLRKACLDIRQPDNFAGGVKRFVAMAGCSHEHVLRTLKKHTGQTPIQLVTAVRLDYATRQLLATTRNIQDISLDCGFSSLPHFYWVFRKRFGISPRRYRMDRFPALTTRTHSRSTKNR